MSNKPRVKNEESNPPSPGGLDPAQPAAPQADALNAQLDLVAQVQDALTEANLTQPAQDVALNPNPTEEEYNQALKQEIDRPVFNAGPVALLLFFAALYYNYKVINPDDAANIDWSLITAEILVAIYNQIWNLSKTDGCPAYMKQDKGRLLKLCHIIVPNNVNECITLTPKQYRTISFIMACMRRHTVSGRRKKGLTSVEKERLLNKTTLSAEELRQNLASMPVNIKKYYKLDEPDAKKKTEDYRISDLKDPNASLKGLTNDAEFAKYMLHISTSTKDDTSTASNTEACTNNKHEGTLDTHFEVQQEPADNTHNTNELHYITEDAILTQNNNANEPSYTPVTNTNAHNMAAASCYFPEYKVRSSSTHYLQICEDPVPEKNNTHIQGYNVNMHLNNAYEHQTENNTNEWWHNNMDMQNNTHTNTNEWHNNTNAQNNTNTNTNEWYYDSTDEDFTSWIHEESDEPKTPSAANLSSRKRSYALVDSDEDTVPRKSRRLTHPMTPQQGEPFATTPAEPEQQVDTEFTQGANVLVWEWLQVMANMAISDPVYFCWAIIPRLKYVIQLAEDAEMNFNGIQQHNAEMINTMQEVTRSVGAPNQHQPQGVLGLQEVQSPVAVDAYISFPQDADSIYSSSDNCSEQANNTNNRDSLRASHDSTS